MEPDAEDGRDAQFTCDLVLQFLEARLETAPDRSHLLARGVESLALGRHRDALPAALEQRAAEAGFEVAHLLADGALRDVACGGGRGKIAAFDNVAEDF